MNPATLLAAGAITIGMTAAAVPAAGAAVVPIAPNQAFHGLVNGVHDNAQITVACPGPTQPGQVGHPTANQTISVAQGPSSGVLSGYTGSLGTSVDASFQLSSAANRFVFTTYGAPQKIPTTMFLPCSGTGPLTFTPLPTSDTARSDVVTVTFVNIAV